MKTNNVLEKRIMICEINSNVSLTIGKEYEILDEIENKVYLIDDNGKRNSYYTSRFKEKK